jgi:hypothetical protein
MPGAAAAPAETLPSADHGASSLPAAFGQLVVRGERLLHQIVDKAPVARDQCRHEILELLETAEGAVLSDNYISPMMFSNSCRFVPAGGICTSAWTWTLEKRNNRAGYQTTRPPAFR